MSTEFKCAYCGTLQSLSLYIQRTMATRAVPEHCCKCGASHSFPSGDVINPPMVGVTPGCRVSPWMLPKYRPVHEGVYECRFGDLVLMLRWDGRVFVDANGASVALRTLSTWRGAWA